MVDLSIIVPARGNPLGLWATLHSCEQCLEGTKIPYNYVIVTNGEKIGVDTQKTIDSLENRGLLCSHLHFDQAVSPPAARGRGAAAADGNTLCFFDNHVLVGSRFFERALLDMDKWDIPILHGATEFYANQDRYYHYKLTLDYNFWAGGSTFPPDPTRPYMSAACGHGAFLVRSDAWKTLGGYGPEELLIGYGGEELIFNLKAWRMGFQTYLDPKLLHYHYAGNRGYSRHYSDEYYTNMMVSANVIGGEEWLYRVYDSFANKGHIRFSHSGKTMYDLMIAAYDRSAQYAKEVDSKSIMSLDELLKWFRRYQVAM